MTVNKTVSLSLGNKIMIIVIGVIVVKEACVDEALKLSQQHVNRSRKEIGCIAHGVHIDSENPQRLVFLEKWQDRASLTKHFEEPTSIEFIKNVKGLVMTTPEMAIYNATKL